MPYLITTAATIGAPLSDDECPRRAVATLEEMQREVERIIFAASGIRVAASTREQGGTVGPLPDGTTITVEPVDGGALIAWAENAGARHLGMNPALPDIIAAYNAAQDA